MSNWEPAVTKEVLAFQFGNTLVIVAKGDKPTPCFEVEVVMSPIKIFPPEYAVLWRQKPGTVLCPQVVVPYEARGIFQQPYHEFVTVHTKAGAQKVRVKILKTPLDEYLGRNEAAQTDAGASASSGGAGAAPSSKAGGSTTAPSTAGGGGGFPGPFGLAAGKGGVRTAVGFSTSLSFDEAFTNALQNLGSFGPSNPDEMEVVQVTGIGAEFGGIAGLHQLFVKIIATLS
jgi:hypothetical protein